MDAADRERAIRGLAEGGGFGGQFLLSSEAGMEPPGSFVSRRIGGWTLAAHPLLPVRDITVGGGAVVGWLVGWAVD